LELELEYGNFAGKIPIQGIPIRRFAFAFTFIFFSPRIPAASSIKLNWDKMTEGADCGPHIFFFSSSFLLLFEDLGPLQPLQARSVRHVFLLRRLQTGVPGTE